MFNWKKLGKIFTPQEFTGRPWLSNYAQAPSTLLFKDYLRIYFSCRPPPDSNGQFTSYSAYIDVDKDNLFNILRVSDTPILELGSLGEFDEFGTYPVSVIRNEDEYRAYYAGWTRCESVPFNVGVGLAISFDKGNTFKKYGRGPIIPYSPDEGFVISGPKIRKFGNLWYLFYIAGRKWIENDGNPEPVYKIRMAISKDGYSWEKMNTDLIPSRIEEDEAQASPDVFFSNEMYHMFFCYRKSKNFRSKDGGYRIGYAFSKDLLKWFRSDDMVGIDVSPYGWDSEMISYPHLFSLHQKIYMLYLGNGVGREGFGLAELVGTLDL